MLDSLGWWRTKHINLKVIISHFLTPVKFSLRNNHFGTPFESIEMCTKLLMSKQGLIPFGEMPGHAEQCPKK